jgi:hypothetical protein
MSFGQEYCKNTAGRHGAITLLRNSAGLPMVAAGGERSVLALPAGSDRQLQSITINARGGYAGIPKGAQLTTSWT